MRWRIGLLQDAAAIERQVAREAAADAAKKHKHANVPTVKTEAQTKVEEQAAAKAAKEGNEPPKPRSQPKIRPLSEAKAIETGANFISETFLFGVAAGLILIESWRQGRKSNQRRNDVAERLSDLEESEKAARLALVELERELLHLRAKEKDGKPSTTVRLLPKAIYEEDKDERKEERSGWFSRITSFVSSGQDNRAAQELLAKDEPGPAEKILVESDRALEEKRKRQEAMESGEAPATQGPKQ